jgi:SAM-dependent methyltransferase
MNQNEIKFFKKKELLLPDATALPFGYLTKAIIIKIRRQLWGKWRDRNARIVWTAAGVSDVSGPTDNVRNYLERKTIRSIMREVLPEARIQSACEVGCGYGRLIMVLKEFADRVVGFEREPHLVDMAKTLLPDVEFYQCDSLDRISQMGKGIFDFVMTCTVLQHLPDEFCRSVIEEIKKVAPRGHILLIEKTDSIKVTENASAADKFISRARPVSIYKDWMLPFTLVKTKERVLENTYDNKSPGTCMLFKAPN